MSDMKHSAGAHERTQVFLKQFVVAVDEVPRILSNPKTILLFRVAAQIVSLIIREHMLEAAKLRAVVGENIIAVKAAHS